MKKAFTLVLSVFILALTSCSLINNQITTSFSIDIDEVFVDQIRNSSRAAAFPEYADWTTIITLKGSTNQKKTVKMTWMDLEPFNDGEHEKNNNVTFDNIPLNAPFDIYVSVYNGGEQFYEASKKGVVLSRAGTTDLTMILKQILNTTYALYNEKYSNGIYLKALVPVETLNGGPVSEGQSFSDFCFNANGEIIWLNGDTPSGEYSTFPFNAPFGGVEKPICCDLTDNSIYVIGQRAEGNMLFAKYPFYKSTNNYCLDPDNLGAEQAIEGSVSFHSFDIPFDEPGYFSYAEDLDELMDFAANNGSLFFGFKKNDENSFFILKYNLKKEGNYISSNYAGKATISFTAATDNPTITDMICIDGYCYVLIKESNWSRTIVYNKTVSRGLIAKINCNTLNVKTAGLSSIKTTPEGSQKTACSYNGDLLFTDEYGHNLYTDYFELPEFTYAGPSESEKQSCFFGPDRFVAIKPKKLVISDTGTYIWTNEDGVSAKKNINRIVYVDLNSLSITDTVDINTEVAEFSRRNPRPYYSEVSKTVTAGSGGITLYKRSISGDRYDYIELTGSNTILPAFAD